MRAASWTTSFRSRPLHYTPANESLIPTGEIKSVRGSAFDFTSAEEIGARIESVEGGYDLNYVLDEPLESGDALRKACVLEDPKSGRVLTIYTDQPGLQFYSGNFLDGSLTGKSGITYAKHGGLCLETQHFPDSNQSTELPSIVLAPGDTYEHVIEHHFSTR